MLCSYTKNYLLIKYLKRRYLFTRKREREEENKNKKRQKQQRKQKYYDEYESFESQQRFNQKPQKMKYY